MSAQKQYGSVTFVFARLRDALSPGHANGTKCPVGPVVEFPKSLIPKAQFLSSWTRTCTRKGAISGPSWVPGIYAITEGI